MSHVLLSDSQLIVSDRLSAMLQNSGCLVVSGPTGFGKQTVANAVADGLGLTFYPVTVDAPARSVCRVLLGHEDLASPRLSELGILAQEDACIFLSGVEKADPELLPTLREIVRQWTVRGLRAEPHGSVLIVGISTDAPNPTVASTDPLILTAPGASLPSRLLASDICQVANSIVSLTGGTSTLTESDFHSVVLPYGGLACLRKWIYTALAESGVLDLSGLADAITVDLAPIIEQIQYRDRRLTLQEYTDWAEQFDPTVRAIVDSLIRKVVERNYVLTGPQFHGLVNDLVLRSGVPRGSCVALAEWQPFSKSGSVMAHRIKERGNWGRAVTLNLADEPSEWEKILPKKGLPVIVTDDFVGTGETISGLVPRLALLLESQPEVQVRILLVAGFARGIQRIRPLEIEFGERVKIVVGRLLRDSDSCFHQESTLLTASQREVLSAFCDAFGKRVGMRIPLGYGGLGALFVFPESIPNTTLPLLWYDAKPDLWKPLLPASMVLA